MPSKPKSKRRAMQKSARLLEIQKAAREVFFTKGFASATMEQIAKHARVSKGTLYLYSTNKDDLYVSLMLPVLDELGRYLYEFAQQVERKTIVSRDQFLSRLFEIYYATYQFDPDGMRIIQTFQLGNHFAAMSKATLETINQRASANYRTTRNVLLQLMRDGILKQRDPIKLTDILWSTLIGIIQLEESKARTTQQDHLKETLLCAFEVIGEGI
jgi:AcrR family transcriptional regulator